ASNSLRVPGPPTATATSNGAVGIHAAKSPHFARSTFMFWSSMAMKRHGCAFFELPAMRAAWRMRRRSSSGIGFSRNERVSRLLTTVLYVSIPSPAYIATRADQREYRLPHPLGDSGLRIDVMAG